MKYRAGEESQPESPGEAGTTRILLTLSYRGGDFSGWQSQSHGAGVQDAVEKALTVLCGKFIRLHGAGRTDAGVHAMGQRAHFDAPPGLRFQCDEWPQILNPNLPGGVRVMQSREVARDFHARFDASGKQYRYRLSTAKVLCPFEAGRAWHVPGLFHEDLFRETLHGFRGEHDFVHFSAGHRRRVRSTIRKITRLDVARVGDMIGVDVEGNGFLYRMVRCLVGIAVRVARKKLAPQQVRRALQGLVQDFPVFAAPPEGLFLMRVFYPSEKLPPPGGKISSP